MKKLLLVALITIGLSVLAMADKPDQPEGTPKVGDRVIYFTDANNDGFFERNVALVVDDVNATARLSPGESTVGNPINLVVFPSFESLAPGSTPAAYFVTRATRGRAVGKYEALTTSNH